MVASPTNSTVKLAKLWCQDQTFCHPLFFHWICTDFPGSKLIPPTNDATRMSFFVFHKLLLVGKASPVPWCMWSKNSVGISLDLGIALHLSLGEIRSQRTAGLVPLQSNTRVKSQMIKGHSTHAINCYHWFVILYLQVVRSLHPKPQDVWFHPSSWDREIPSAGRRACVNSWSCSSLSWQRKKIGKLRGSMGTPATSLFRGWDPGGVVLWKVPENDFIEWRLKN